MELGRALPGSNAVVNFIFLTIANPDSSSDVVAVALSFARLMCNLLHVRPSLSSYGSPLAFFGLLQPLPCVRVIFLRYRGSIDGSTESARFSVYPIAEDLFARRNDDPVAIYGARKVSLGECLAFGVAHLTVGTHENRVRKRFLNKIAKRPWKLAR